MKRKEIWDWMSVILYRQSEIPKGSELLSDDTLRDYGLDVFDCTEVEMAIEEELCLTLPKDINILPETTIGEIVDIIVECQKKQDLK